MTAPILMSAENPQGWKLEELLHQLQLEIAAKSAKIADDPSPAAGVVRWNNSAIIAYLENAARLQRASLLELGLLGPDPGPLGPPRIGTRAPPP